MEKPFNEIDEIAKRIVKEAGLEKPSVNFSSLVLEAITQRAAYKHDYKPLISVRGWWLVSLLFVLATILLLGFSMPNLGYIEIVEFWRIPKFENPLSGLELSKTMVYGIGFLALFLVQIPFLKNHVNKSLRSSV